jgi:hypothetical protein
LERVEAEELKILKKKSERARKGVGGWAGGEVRGCGRRVGEAGGGWISRIGLKAFD